MGNELISVRGDFVGVPFNLTSYPDNVGWCVVIDNLLPRSEALPGFLGGFLKAVWAYMKKRRLQGTSREVCSSARTE